MIEMIVAGALLGAVIYGTGLYLWEQRRSLDDVKVKDAATRREEQIRDRVLAKAAWFADAIAAGATIPANGGCGTSAVHFASLTVNEAVASQCLDLPEATGLQGTLVLNSDTLPPLSNGLPVPSPGLVVNEYNLCKTKTTIRPGGTDLTGVTQLYFCMIFTPTAGVTVDENHNSVMTMKPFIGQFTYFKFFPTSTTTAPAAFTFNATIPTPPTFPAPAPVSFLALKNSGLSFVGIQPSWLAPVPPFINYLYYKLFWASVELGGPIQKSLSGVNIRSSTKY